MDYSILANWMSLFPISVVSGSFYYSDLGLRCLLMSLLWDNRLKGVIKFEACFVIRHIWAPG